MVINNKLSYLNILFNFQVMVFLGLIISLGTNLLKCQAYNIKKIIIIVIEMYHLCIKLFNKQLLS